MRRPVLVLFLIFETWWCSFMSQCAFGHSVCWHMQSCAANIRSPDRKNQLLKNPRTAFVSWAFRNAAPIVWNSLPYQLTSSPASICRNLIKHFFSRSFHHWLPLLRFVNLIWCTYIASSTAYYYYYYYYYFIFIFHCPRYLDSRGLKTKIKNSWRGYFSGSHTKLSRKRTKLKRCRVIARSWKRKVDSRRSLDLVLILRPSE